ncbi:hypothetical protein [Frigoribacterium sp. NPDC087798]|uniref:hypothetical protein n=1 Tax=Frigoribacterium sp. NPDC087798 TaxID=3363993 RepID=UPI0038042682
MLALGAIAIAAGTSFAFLASGNEAVYVVAAVLLLTGSWLGVRALHVGLYLHSDRLISYGFLFSRTIKRAWITDVSEAPLIINYRVSGDSLGRSFEVWAFSTPGDTVTRSSGAKSRRAAAMAIRRWIDEQGAL